MLPTQHVLLEVPVITLAPCACVLNRHSGAGASCSGRDLGPKKPCSCAVASGLDESAAPWTPCAGVHSVASAPLPGSAWVMTAFTCLHAYFEVAMLSNWRCLAAAASCTSCLLHDTRFSCCCSCCGSRYVKLKVPWPWLAGAHHMGVSTKSGGMSDLREHLLRPACPPCCGGHMSWACGEQDPEWKANGSGRSPQQQQQRRPW